MRCSSLSRLPACCWRCCTIKPRPSSPRRPNVTPFARPAARISWRIVPASSPAARRRSSACCATTPSSRRLAGTAVNAVGAEAGRARRGRRAGGRAPAQSEAAPPAAKVERAPPGIQVAPAEAQSERLKTVQQACTLNDFVAHCSWIAPNNPEILLCLKANTADLSPNCQAAVQSLPAAPPPAAAAPPAEPAQQAAPAKKPTEPKPPEPARASAPPAPAAPASSAAAPAGPNGAAESRHPRRMPVRFHVPLLRRTARRRRSVAMSQAQRGAALGSMPQRRGRDRGGGAGAAAAPSGAPAATAAPGRAHRADADAAPARGAGDRANLRRRSTVALCRHSVRRRPDHQLPRRKRIEPVAELLQRAERGGGPIVALP